VINITSLIRYMGCYTSPTFYRMTKAILKHQMYGNVFTHVDDIVVASKKKAIQIDDLAETFVNMRGA
jgi:hypothetical protein